MHQKYKEAIYFFREHPEEVYTAWYDPHGHPHGCLFHFLSPDGHAHTIRGQKVGCPTMLRLGTYIAWSPELAERCVKEIQNSIYTITDQELQLIGEIQTECDQTIRNPEWLKEHRFSMYPGAFDADVLNRLNMFIAAPQDEDEKVLASDSD